MVMAQDVSFDADEALRVAMANDEQRRQAERDQRRDAAAAVHRAWEELWQSWEETAAQFLDARAAAGYEGSTVVTLSPGTGPRRRPSIVAGWWLWREGPEGDDFYLLADGCLAFGRSRDACTAMAQGTAHDDGTTRTRDRLRRSVRAAGGEPAEDWPEAAS